MRQLALPFAVEQNYAVADFCNAPSNAMARDWLAGTEAWSNGQLVLWGEAGCGKTHLLHIWAATTGAVIIGGAALQGLIRPCGPVAIDDADIAPDPRALLHLLNAATEGGHKVLMTSRLPPARQSHRLADLASRLRAAEAVEIRAPEDELLAMLLARLAADRQLALSISLQNFLLSRLPRTAAALREAVARLDRAARDSRLKISRQLASELLSDFLEPERE